MADGWDGGFDFLDDYDDDNWLYIEDDFALADELAEGQIADPGFAGTSFELEMGGFDFQIFAYWNDIEYMDDDYWDYAIAHNRSGSRATKSGLGKKPPSGRKPLLNHRHMNFLDPLIFRSQEERSSLKNQVPLLSSSATSYALFPDWRKRFAQDESAHMPRASSTLSTSSAARQPTKFSKLPTEETNRESFSEMLSTLKSSSIGPDVLRTVIKDQLAANGLEGLDESVLLGVIAQAISGSRSLDSSVEALTQNMFTDVGGDVGEGEPPDEPTDRRNANDTDVLSESEYGDYSELDSPGNHAEPNTSHGLDETRQSSHVSQQRSSTSQLTLNCVPSHVFAAPSARLIGKQLKRKSSTRDESKNTHASTEEQRKRRTLGA